MSGITVKVLLQDVRKLETEALIVGFHEDVRPLRNLAGELDWLLCGSLSDLIIKHKVRGSSGDVALLPSQGKIPARKIFLVGLGSKETMSSDAISSLARTLTSMVIKTGVRNAAMECIPISGMSYEVSIPPLLRGMSEGAGGASFNLTLLAPDSAAYVKISRMTKGWSDSESFS